GEKLNQKTGIKEIQTERKARKMRVKRPKIERKIRAHEDPAWTEQLPNRLTFKILPPELPFGATRLSTVPTDMLRRVLVKACKEATGTLKWQQDTTLMTHATKGDVLGFDYALQSILMMWIK